MKIDSITVSDHGDVVNVTLVHKQAMPSVSGFPIKGHGYVLDNPRYLKSLVGFAVNAAAVADINGCTIDEVWDAIDAYCDEHPLKLAAPEANE